MKGFNTIEKCCKSTILLFAILIAIQLDGNNYVNAQDIAFKKSSIRTGVGVGINEGLRETGFGLVYSLGWQQGFGEKNRLRINPNMLYGGFMPIIMLHTREQFYRITSLGINIHYDLIKYKAVSIVTTVGGFVNYSRGLLGTGGWRDANNTNSEYFLSLYFGGSGSIALRINPKNSRLAYEIRPINIHLGNKQFILGYLMFGIDIKFEK